MKKLYKSNNKQVCGVCAGLAEYLDMDVTVVRLVFLLLILVCGVSIWTYIIAAIVMPEAPADYNSNATTGNTEENNDTWQ